MSYLQIFERNNNDVFYDTDNSYSAQFLYKGLYVELLHNGYCFEHYECNCNV